MFHKSIVELQKIRKFVDHRKIDLADDAFISQGLDDISYTLTIAIQDLIRIDKALLGLNKFKYQRKDKNVQLKKTLCDKK